MRRTKICRYVTLRFFTLETPYYIGHISGSQKAFLVRNARGNFLYFQRIITVIRSFQIPYIIVPWRAHLRCVWQKAKEEGGEHLAQVVCKKHIYIRIFFHFVLLILCSTYTYICYTYNRRDHDSIILFRFSVPSFLCTIGQTWHRYSVRCSIMINEVLHYSGAFFAVAFLYFPHFLCFRTWTFFRYLFLFTTHFIIERGTYGGRH